MNPFSGGPDQSEGDQGKPEEPRGHQPETARTGEIIGLMSLGRITHDYS